MNRQSIPIDDIFTNENNPRVIKTDRFHRLVKMIADFPKMLEIRPIVIDENNRILAGNMRYRACKELKFEYVIVVRAENLTEDQKDEFIVKDNLAFGEWDWGKINMMFDSDELLDFGFFEDDMNMIEDGFEGRQDDAPETYDKSDTIFAFGDIRFKIGREEYENWINNLKLKVGFDDLSVENALRKKLNL